MPAPISVPTALSIREPLSGDYRFTCKQDRRSLRIYAFVGAADAILCGIDSLVDDTPADALVSSALPRPAPVKSRAAGVVRLWQATIQPHGGARRNISFGCAEG